MSSHNSRLYDQNNYYDADGVGSRLDRRLDSLLYFLDWFKAFTFFRKSKKILGSSARDFVALDVGAGDGKFLYFMRQLGAKVHGTTASSISQKAAKSRFGIDIEHTTELPSPPERVGLLTYWHVFEHLEDPEAHVKSWGQILADSSVVMIEVPNISGFGAKLSFDAWLGSDIKHHINHMTPEQILGLAGKYGFTARREEFFSLKFTIPFLWSALLGAIFRARNYSFDAVFDLLKTPGKSLKERPLLSLNAYLALVYLSPLLLVLAFAGTLLKRGEIYRVYLSK